MTIGQLIFSVITIVLFFKGKKAFEENTDSEKKNSVEKKNDVGTKSTAKADDSSTPENEPEKKDVTKITDPAVATGPDKANSQTETANTATSNDNGVTTGIASANGTAVANNSTAATKLSSAQKQGFATYCVAIVALFVAIFDPVKTPKISDIINGLIESSIDDSSSENGYESNNQDKKSDSETNTFTDYSSSSFPKIDTEGAVKEHVSATDYFGNNHSDVVYLEGGSVRSRIIIHTNGAYSFISFDLNAVKGMNPLGRLALRIYIDKYKYAFDEIAGIPETNKSTRYTQSIVNADTVTIEFLGYEPTEDDPCAVFLSYLCVY